MSAVEGSDIEVVRRLSVSMFLLKLNDIGIVWHAALGNVSSGALGSAISYS